MRLMTSTMPRDDAQGGGDDWSADFQRALIFPRHVSFAIKLCIMIHIHVLVISSCEVLIL